MTSLRIFSESASKSSRIRAATLLVLADEAEQNVLRADVVVAEAQRLAQRELEHLLRAAESISPGRDLLARADDVHDLRADALDRDVQQDFEHTGSETLLLARSRPRRMCSVPM